VITLLLTAVAVAADTYQTGKIVKWDNGTYPDKKKTKAWIVYQVQGERPALFHRSSQGNQGTDAAG
jgi:hypothetical protein